MKNKGWHNPVFRVFIFLSILVLLTSGVAIGLFYYVFSIPEPEGLSLASWPVTFTDTFSWWMECKNGTISVKESGLARLEEYGLWVQVMNEAGQEVFSYRKPVAYPESYPASELIVLDASRYENGYTIFAGIFEDSGGTWSYIIGFPYAIGKSMLYYNGGNVGRLSPVFRMVIFFAFCATAIFVLTYGFWLTHQLGKITNGIGNISLRTYQPLKENGIFGGIYESLNRMDMKIRHSERVKEETERVRREWITNITHDLKTPLSPIKGYAELLAEGAAADNQTAQEYGSIILKNVNHTEKLINDLKLTYQLESGAFPYRPKAVRLIRYLKELIIDIANDPAFSGRSIEFASDLPEFTAAIDPDLFRRAVQNLVINALVHNPPDTAVTISVAHGKEKGVRIFIRDNGVGMSRSEQAEIFTRYYRGTSTQEKPEGSGLGLAIAKQIITLHGATIAIKSGLGKGTEFAIYLPTN